MKNNQIIGRDNMSRKKLSQEELENVSGGACSGGGGTIKCPDCDSTNLTELYSTYSKTRYKCNDCNAEFTVDTNSL